MSTVTVRLPEEKKTAAQELAKELGVSLSSLINIRINDFLRKKSITVQLQDTDDARYTDANSIEVNEDIDTVISSLTTITQESDV